MCICLHPICTLFGRYINKRRAEIDRQIIEIIDRNKGAIDRKFGCIKAEMKAIWFSSNTNYN